MNAKDYLHQAIEQLDDEDADVMMKFVSRFIIPDDLATRDDLMAIEEGRRSYYQGDFVSLDDYDAKRKAAD